MNNNILHIFVDEKFVFEFIEKIDCRFDNQVYYVWSKSEKTHNNFPQIKNIYFSSSKNMIGSIKELLTLAKNSDKIIFHSLIYPAPLLITASYLAKKNRNKTMWVEWGADLFDHYWERNNSLSTKIREIFRRKFIKNVYSVGCLEQELPIIKEYYDVSPKFYLAPYFFYFPDINLSVEKHDYYNVLIGNSANPTCCHKDAIDFLSKYMNNKYYCILSYPKDNMEYINSVIEYGNSKIGSNFVPITDFMTNEEYSKFLSTIDLAVLNNNRQQGWGNIISLLYYGKTLYINPENILLDYFTKEGAIIYSTKELESGNMKLLNNEEIDNNIRVAKKLLSEDYIYDCWNRIFTDKWEK